MILNGRYRWGTFTRYYEFSFSDGTPSNAVIEQKDGRIGVLWYEPKYVPTLGEDYER